MICSSRANFDFVKINKLTSTPLHLHQLIICSTEWQAVSPRVRSRPRKEEEREADRQESRRGGRLPLRGGGLQHELV